jgi:hypothetical protein
VRMEFLVNHVDYSCLSFEVMLSCGFLWILEVFCEFKGFGSQNKN